MPGSNFDIKKVIKKFGTGLAYAAVPFILAYSIEFLETETFPLEYAVYITLAIAALHALTNAVKHWNDS